MWKQILLILMREKKTHRHNYIFLSHQIKNNRTTNLPFLISLYFYFFYLWSWAIRAKNLLLKKKNDHTHYMLRTHSFCPSNHSYIRIYIFTLQSTCTLGCRWGNVHTLILSVQPFVWKAIQMKGPTKSRYDPKFVGKNWK